MNQKKEKDETNGYRNTNGKESDDAEELGGRGGRMSIIGHDGTELAIARGNGTYRKVIQQYKKPALLIIDEWLLYPLKESEARDLLEIAEARYKKASTIFCSQFDILGWREKIGDPILADAICDRIVHDSYSMVIECKESMRKRKGVSIKLCFVLCLFLDL